MSFLSNLFTSLPPSFPYTLSNPRPLQLQATTWTLHSATHKQTNEICSALVFDKRKADESERRIAAHAAKKWRTVRHPGVVRVRDVAEVLLLGQAIRQSIERAADR